MKIALGKSFTRGKHNSFVGGILYFIHLSQVWNLDELKPLHSKLDGIVNVTMLNRYKIMLIFDNLKMVSLKTFASGVHNRNNKIFNSKPFLFNKIYNKIRYNIPRLLLHSSLAFSFSDPSPQPAMQLKTIQNILSLGLSEMKDILRFINIARANYEHFKI